MPLRLSASRDAFLHNLKAELRAGKPKKQALAIAYAQRRRARGGGEDARGLSVTSAAAILAPLQIPVIDGLVPSEYDKILPNQPLVLLINGHWLFGIRGHDDSLLLFDSLGLPYDALQKVVGKKIPVRKWNRYGYQAEHSAVCGYYVIFFALHWKGEANADDIFAWLPHRVRTPPTLAEWVKEHDDPEINRRLSINDHLIARFMAQHYPRFLYMDHLAGDHAPFVGTLHNLIIGDPHFHLAGIQTQRMSDFFENQQRLRLPDGGPPRPGAPIPPILPQAPAAQEMGLPGQFRQAIPPPIPEPAWGVTEPPAGPAWERIVAPPVAPPPTIDEFVDNIVAIPHHEPAAATLEQRLNDAIAGPDRNTVDAADEGDDFVDAMDLGAEETADMRPPDLENALPTYDSESSWDTEWSSTDEELPSDEEIARTLVPFDNTRAPTVLPTDNAEVNALIDALRTSVQPWREPSQIPSREPSPGLTMQAIVPGDETALGEDTNDPRATNAPSTRAVTMDTTPPAAITGPIPLAPNQLPPVGIAANNQPDTRTTDVVLPPPPAPALLPPPSYAAPDRAEEHAIHQRGNLLAEIQKGIKLKPLSQRAITAPPDPGLDEPTPQRAIAAPPDPGLLGRLTGWAHQLLGGAEEPPQQAPRDLLLAQIQQGVRLRKSGEAHPSAKQRAIEAAPPPPAEANLQTQLQERAAQRAEMPKIPPFDALRRMATEPLLKLLDDLLARAAMSAEGSPELQRGLVDLKYVLAARTDAAMGLVPISDRARSFLGIKPNRRRAFSSSDEEGEGGQGYGALDEDLKQMRHQMNTDKGLTPRMLAHAVINSGRHERHALWRRIPTRTRHAVTRHLPDGIIPGYRNLKPVKQGPVRRGELSPAKLRAITAALAS